MLSNPWFWAAVGAFVALLAGVLYLVLLTPRDSASRGRHRRSSGRPHRDSFRSAGHPLEPEPLKRAAVVVAPDAPGQEAARLQIRERSREQGWDAPLWLVTSDVLSTTDAVRQARGAGVDLVLSLGGDEVVRQVAEALAGTGTPMGFLPTRDGSATLPRHLGMDTADLYAALDVALNGENRRVDVGRVTIGEPDTESEPMVFVSTVVLGDDPTPWSEPVEKVEEPTGKAARAWLSSARQRLRRRTGYTVRISPEDEEARSQRVVSIIVGNAGQLVATAGAVPDADLSDGRLDCVVIDATTVSGLVRGARRAVSSKPGNPRLHHHASATFHLTGTDPVPVHVDGRPHGQATHLEIGVDPLALVVRVGDVTTRAAIGSPMQRQDTTP